MFPRCRKTYEGKNSREVAAGMCFCLCTCAATCMSLCHVCLCTHPCSLNGDSEHNEGEEDFYYSEIEVNVDSLSEGLSSLLPASPSTVPPPLTFPPSHTPARAAPIAIAVQPALKFFTSPLSQSAPSVLCHIHTDHAYQVKDTLGLTQSTPASCHLSVYTWLASGASRLSVSLTLLTVCLRPHLHRRIPGQSSVRSG